MAYPITNYTRVWVRGRFVDLAKAAREETSYGLTGPVQFIPQINVALNPGLKQIIGMAPFTATPATTDGYFAINLPATNDPDINPVDFKYKVVEPTGRSYLITVPYDTPTLTAPGDPLNGQQVLELVNIVPDPDNPEGTVQLLVGQPGRGIADVDIDVSGHLIITYTDATTADAGVVAVSSVAGKTGAVSLVKADVGLGSVDNTADSAKPVSTAQSAAITAAVSAHTAASDPHPQYLTAAEGDADYLQTGAAIPITGINSLSSGRFVGFKMTTGAPSSGAFLVRDLVWNTVDRKWYHCTVAGSPGTWQAEL